MILKIVSVFMIILLVSFFVYASYNLYLNFFSEPKFFNISRKPLVPIQASELQFYPNIRFNHNNISYKIGDECNEQKQEAMLWAFSYLENTTILKFYEITEDSDIEIRCGEEYRKGDFFVAGEGGPEMMINTSLFSTVLKGKILLLSENECLGNVALHELLHVFGFKHLEGERSIMYHITFCSQIVNPEILSEIERLYSIEPYPELYFESVNGTKKGSYANLNFVVVNQGLKDAENVNVFLYSDNEELEKFELKTIEIGSGRILSVENLKVPMLAENFKLLIKGGKELDESNNAAILSLA